MINIRDYIPIGHNNAITRETLHRMVGESDRTIRMMIAKANKDADEPPIINMSDGKGYFIPAEDEEDLIIECERCEISRSREIEERIRNMRKYRENKYQYKMEDVFV